MITLSQIRDSISTSSATEVIEQCLERIKNSRFNTFITVAAGYALSAADSISEHPGPLAGVPIAIKDNISTAGIQTTCASRILTGYVPPYDAHVITRLKNAGAIIAGKVNMDEFAMGTSTESSFYGPTKNPWDDRCVPGGSSGGSAASVAAGEVPVSLGSDTGGSVRCPASFCGVVGLKPTYGVISRYGLISYANSLEQIGPIASCVEDMTVLFNVIAGHDPRDSTSVPGEKDYTASLVDDVQGLRIGVPEEYFGEGTDPAVERSVWDAVHVLEELGASWTKVEMPHIKYALAAYYIIAMSEASSNLARFDGMRYGLRLEKDHDWHTTYSEIRAAGFGEEVKRRILLGTYALSAGYMDRYYLKALKVRTLIKQDFEKALKDTDVLLAPTMPTPAFKIGEKISDPLTLYRADVNTVPVNLAGVPSVSLPCGFSGGLPIGLQIMGRHFDEMTVIRTAYAFEKNTDHHIRDPVVN